MYTVSSVGDYRIPQGARWTHSATQFVRAYWDSNVCGLIRGLAAVASGFPPPPLSSDLFSSASYEPQSFATL